MSSLAALLGVDHRHCEIRVLPCGGALRAQLYRRCEVTAESFDESGASMLRLVMSPEDHGWLESKGEFRGQWDYVE